MPDIISIINLRWRLIFLLTLLATVVALIATLLSPKLYLSTATALPANPVLSDKARIFNPNIEELYPSLGTPDELDKIEGTTKLDTIFIAIANDFQLAAHYGINENDALHKAALKLKKNSDISRSAYGELRLRVWDKDKMMAAQLANAYLQKLNEFHQHIQTANSAMVLQKIKEDLAAKQNEMDSAEQSMISFKTGSPVYNRDDQQYNKNDLANDTLIALKRQSNSDIAGNINTLSDQVKEYRTLINQYELSLKTTPAVLVVVENARPALVWDKPNLPRNLAFAFFAALVFSILLAVFIDGRNKEA
jgi:capsular polysaccharide biosynthesis protein